MNTKTTSTIAQLVPGKTLPAASNPKGSPCSQKPEFEIGDLLVAYLEQLDIEYVFGVRGGAIKPLLNALARSERNNGPRAVVSRHENGGVFMADGYARNSGKLGVCCTTTGPGATNAITGVATAYENNTPLLVSQCGLLELLGFDLVASAIIIIH